MKTNLRVSKVVVPNEQPSQQEWFRQFNVSTGYIEPTPYFKDNHFDTEVFKKSKQTADQSILSGIINFLTTFTWAV
jgi:hypothetical protein